MKRYRPLGLTIAIVSIAIGYGIIPMLPILLILWSQITRRNVGVDFVGGPTGWFDVGLGALTLLGCLFAWVGRPYGVRRALLALVWMRTLLIAVRIVEAVTAPAVVIGEVGGTFSGATGLLCQLPLILFIPLYATWYLNRAPARQFYAPRQ